MYSARFGSFDAAMTSSDVRVVVFGAPAAASIPSASNAFVRSAASVSMPANRSPTRANRSQTLSMRKSCGSKPPAATSSHVSGVETGARGSGRIEYAAAMFAPERFMLWSMKILPVRSAIFHAIVTRSGSACRMSRPHRPTSSRT